MQLNHNEIHLWQTTQSDFALKELESACLGWLSGTELQRFQRLQFEHHRKQLLLGRLLTRRVLSEYAADVAPANWCFIENKYGKPAIDQSRHDAQLHFNLTHSGGKLVLAVARVEALGVDIESCDKPRRVERIARRYFSSAEVASLLRLPATRNLSRFYELWTLKESYIKACGMGLAIPLQQFSFLFANADSIDIKFDATRKDNGSAWQFWQLDAGVTHKLAVAVRHQDARRIERLFMHGFGNKGLQPGRELEPGIILRSTRGSELQ